MAKRGRKPKVTLNIDNQPAAAQITRGAETKLEGFAEDLGRLIGSAQAKAESWLGQRKRIVANLTDLRNTVNGLLTELGEGVQRGVRRGRPASSNGAAAKTAGPRKKRKMSAKAWKAISDAQKKRWAKLRHAHT